MWTLRLFSVKNSGTDGQILHDFPSSGWKSVKWLRVLPVVAITLAWQIVQATCFSSNFSTSHVARWILKCTRHVWVNTTGFSRSRLESVGIFTFKDHCKKCVLGRYSATCTKHDKQPKAVHTCISEDPEDQVLYPDFLCTFENKL